MWSVWWLPTGWVLQGSNPSEDEIFCTIHNGLWVQPASYTIGTRSFPGVKRLGHGVDHLLHSSKGKVIPLQAQRVGRGIALLFHFHGTRRGWVVSSTVGPHLTPGKDLVPIVQEAGWAQGPAWMGGKSRPHRDSIPDRPARSQSLYWLSYPSHTSL